MAKQATWPIGMTGETRDWMDRVIQEGMKESIRMAKKDKVATPDLKTTKIPKPLSVGEEELVSHLRIYQVPFEREVQFDPERKWRADFGIDPMILVEVEGGIHVRGRHQRSGGFEKDCEKYNRATLLGYRVFRFSTYQVHSGVAIDTILEAVAKWRS